MATEKLISVEHYQKTLERFHEHLIAHGKQEGAEAVRTIIKGLKIEPAVDTGEVVRCKDCKDHDRCEVEDLLRYFDPTSEPYCSVGERKDNG